MKFTLECEMKERWAPHFISMLRYMETLGKLGASRKVCIYADGDGDFRPKFRIVEGATVENVDPIENKRGNCLYDAG